MHSRAELLKGDGEEQRRVRPSLQSQAYLLKGDGEEQGVPGTSAALLAATESAPCKRARALAAAALASGSGARPRAAAALAPGPRAAERAPRFGAKTPAVRESPGSDAAPLAATPWAPGTGAKRRAAATRAPGNKVLVLGLGVLIWACAMVVSGTGQQETSGGMGWFQTRFKTRLSNSWASRRRRMLRIWPGPRPGLALRGR